MKNKLLLVSCILIPFTVLANTINDIKELRAKIKETAEEIRIVCEGYTRYPNRVGQNNIYYCNYLEKEVNEYIKKVLELENNLKEK
jgi:hypothetical protein